MVISGVNLKKGEELLESLALSMFGKAYVELEEEQKARKIFTMKGLASVEFNNEFVIHNIKLIEGEKGLFIAMPAEKISTGEFKDIFYPTTIEARDMIMNEIINVYKNKESYTNIGKTTYPHINVTDIRIKMVNGTNGLRAVATIVLDNSFCISKIFIIDDNTQIKVIMPCFPNSDKEMACYINIEDKIKLNDIIINEYRKIKA